MRNARIFAKTIAHNDNAALRSSITLLMTQLMTSKKILVIGSSNTDMSVKSIKLPKPGETVLGDDFRMGPGGKGANQAVAARRLGGDVTFICKLGKDMFGEKALEHYRSCGLDVSRILYSDKPSGIALITVDSLAENSIVVASGANADITPEDIDASADIIRSAGMLLLQLEIPMPAVVRAAEIAHESGVKVVLNPAPATKLPEDLLRCVSILIPNETEASAISGIDITDLKTAGKAANLLKSKGVHEIIITMGSRGSVVCDGETTFIPARKVNAVDTTAAGDTFCGGVCVALSEGKDIYDAVRFATVASSIAVQRPGAQDSVPSRQEVDYIMNNN